MKNDKSEDQLFNQCFFAVERFVGEANLAEYKLVPTRRLAPVIQWEDQEYRRSLHAWQAQEQGLNAPCWPEEPGLSSNAELYRRLERRPIIGANCSKHRNYYATTMTSQPTHLPVPDHLPINGASSMGGAGPPLQGITIENVPQMSSSPRVTTYSERFLQDNDEVEGIDCSPCCSNDNIRRTFRNVIYGQILSLCLCGTGVSSQLLSNRGMKAPTAQSFLNYFFLSSVYGTMLVFRKGDDSFWPVLRKHGWRYLMLSFVDVEANFMIVYAYQFTNLTSIQLLDCSTIPMVLLLSWLFLSTRYLVSHIVGVAICLLGIAVLIWADALGGKGVAGGSNRLLGDILCLAGSLLYAIGNVGEEHLVKHNSRVEYLGMVGLFGSIISGIQLAAFEHGELAAVQWSGAMVALYMLFASCMFIFYSLVSVLVQKSSALMFNLSILTADFYALLFGLFLFKYEFDDLYFLSFALVIAGSVTYSLRNTQKRTILQSGNFCDPLTAIFNRSTSLTDFQPQHFTHQQAQPDYLMPSFGGIRTIPNDAAAYMASSTAIHECPVHGRRSPFVQISPIQMYS